MEEKNEQQLAVQFKLLQKHKAFEPFGVALELGFCEMRVLLTP